MKNEKNLFSFACPMINRQNWICMNNSFMSFTRMIALAKCSFWNFFLKKNWNFKKLISNLRGSRPLVGSRKVERCKKTLSYLSVNAKSVQLLAIFTKTFEIYPKLHFHPRRVHDLILAPFHSVGVPFNTKITPKPYVKSTCDN